jgi:hypothetical protein
MDPADLGLKLKVMIVITDAEAIPGCLGRHCIEFGCNLADISL